MARPTQRKDGVIRNIRQPVAFTFVEYGLLLRSAYESNISVSELIRFRTLTRKVERPPTTPKLNAQLYKELNSLGINLNQIVKKVNIAINIDIDPTVHIDQLQELFDELSTLLEQIHFQLEATKGQRLPIEKRKLLDKSLLDRKLSIRLAADEYETIKQKAHSAKTSISKFIRRAALRQQVTEPPPPLIINWKLYKELGSINVNIKQLARVPFVKHDELIDLIEFLQQTQIQLIGADVEEDEKN